MTSGPEFRTLSAGPLRLAPSVQNSSTLDQHE